MAATFFSEENSDTILQKSPTTKVAGLNIFLKEIIPLSCDGGCFSSLASPLMPMQYQA